MKTYTGIREGAVTWVAVAGRLLDPRLDLWNHSPSGFEWGYAGSGPAQLALALLADHLGSDELAIKFHQPFKHAVVASLPRSGWTLTSNQIAKSLELIGFPFSPSQVNAASKSKNSRLLSRRPVPIAVFRLGRLVATPNALNSLTQKDILMGIKRHQAGDWGDLGAEDRVLNDRALVAGTRVLSAYRAENGIRFWIITEADRSVTTVLLPEDY